jgi:hypothetical protein
MNILERYIFFDEPSHKYTDDCGNIYTSVTTCIHKFVNPFEKEYWAKKKAFEANTSEASIKQQWANINKDSINKGNVKHNGFETAIKETSKFYKAVNIVTINGILRCFSVSDLINNTDIGEADINAFYTKIGYKYPLIFQTIEYYVNLGYKIYSEINVYDAVNLVSGTIDVLLVKGSEFVIIDWKTGRNEIKFEAGYYKKDKGTNELTNIWTPSVKYMLYPMDNIQDCVGNHYTLQLSIYASMVESFGYTCKALILFHIQDTYILNNWGMPKKNEEGIYIIDKTKPEIVKPHIISYLRDAALKIRNYIGRDAIVSNQQKIIM